MPELPLRVHLALWQGSPLNAHVALALSRFAVPTNAHVLYLYVPALCNTFLRESFFERKGKNSHRAIERTKEFYCICSQKMGLVRLRDHMATFIVNRRVLALLAGFLGCFLRTLFKTLPVVRFSLRFYSLVTAWPPPLRAVNRAATPFPSCRDKGQPNRVTGRTLQITPSSSIRDVAHPRGCVQRLPSQARPRERASSQARPLRSARLAHSITLCCLLHKSACFSTGFLLGKPVCCIFSTLCPVRRRASLSLPLLLIRAVITTTESLRENLRDRCRR